MGHCVPLYLMNSGTQNFFGTTTFGTRHIVAARTGSYKSTPSMTLILASSVAMLDYLAWWDSLTNASMTARAGADVADCTNARLY